VPLRAQVERGDLRSAEEAERGGSMPRPRLVLQKHVTDTVGTYRVLAGIFWEHRCTRRRKPHLAAMGVPGKLQAEAAGRRGGIGEVKLGSCTSRMAAPARGSRASTRSGRGRPSQRSSTSHRWRKAPARSKVRTPLRKTVAPPSRITELATSGPAR
jgi:hypothetical protein